MSETRLSAAEQGAALSGQIRYLTRRGWRRFDAIRTVAIDNQLPPKYVAALAAAAEEVVLSDVAS